MSDNPTYDAKAFQVLCEREDRHFWFRARNRVIGAVLDRVEPRLHPPYRVVEIGCGTGNTLRTVERVCHRGDVIGMDLFSEGLALARQRVRCQLIQADVHHLQENEAYDMVCLFDVLEHLDDDDAILQAIHRILKPGGLLILTVPALASLWSYFDEWSCHRRRYERVDLNRRLVEAGFMVEQLSFFMSLLLPLAYLTRRRRGGASAASPTREELEHEFRIIPVLNSLLDVLLRFEAPRLGRGRSLPWGTSLLGVARKI
jgi:SAM-dependent methyltransferase